MLKRLQALRQTLHERRRHEARIAELERINAAEANCGAVGTMACGPNPPAQNCPEPPETRLS
jgi:hypothetical protein